MEKTRYGRRKIIKWPAVGVIWDGKRSSGRRRPFPKMEDAKKNESLSAINKRHFSRFLLEGEEAKRKIIIFILLGAGNGGRKRGRQKNAIRSG